MESCWEGGGPWAWGLVPTASERRVTGLLCMGRPRGASSTLFSLRCPRVPGIAQVMPVCLFLYFGVQWERGRPGLPIWPLALGLLGSRDRDKAWLTGWGGSSWH